MHTDFEMFAHTAWAFRCCEFDYKVKGLAHSFPFDLPPPQECNLFAIKSPRGIKKPMQIFFLFNANTKFFWYLAMLKTRLAWPYAQHLCEFNVKLVSFSTTIAVETSSQLLACINTQYLKLFTNECAYSLAHEQLKRFCKLRLCKQFDTYLGFRFIAAAVERVAIRKISKSCAMTEFRCWICLDVGHQLLCKF